jgi:HEPN domain-containing protein
MRDSKESLYPKDWIRKAKRDLHRAKVLLADADTEGAGFHLQQAIEKYLKAYLLSKGWELQYVHDLVKLLNSAKDHDPSFEEFRPLCEQVTEYYILVRYPLSEEAPDVAELERAWRKTEDLGNKIDTQVK